MRRKVFCFGCSHLFYVHGKLQPMCVGSAEFVEGPLRKKIDVVGVVSAEKRNVHNDCTYRTGVSIRAWELKRWLLWRLNDGNKRRIEEASIERYSVKKEHDRKRETLERIHGRKEGDESNSEEIDFSEARKEIEGTYPNEGESSSEDSAEEAILDGRGDNGDDDTGSSGTDGREGVQDAEAGAE